MVKEELEGIWQISRRITVKLSIYTKRILTAIHSDDQSSDDQPSLVYSVEIDNADPHAFQLLDLVGYPKREENDENGKEVWALYFVDERIDSALGLIDSALLTIERN